MVVEHGQLLHNGRSANINASLGSLDLPAKAIISVEYDTTHYGYDPIGESAPCFGSSGGCPYDSLNVGVGDGDPARPRASRRLARSRSPMTRTSPVDRVRTAPGAAGPYGVFRLDAGCWTGYQPLFTVTATD